MNHLKIKDLKEGYCYKIIARNAYIGVWISNGNKFLVSRYKAGPNPLLRYEYHWDIGDPLGTAKPIEEIERFPFKIKSNYEKSKSIEITQYLDLLELKHPLPNIKETPLDRKQSAINFIEQLSKNHKK